MRNISLKYIRCDGETQSRVAIDREVVAEYAEAMRAGVKFPPLIVFNDGNRHWLAEGFHRLEAARSIDAAGKIRCDVRKGTLDDARWFSYTANQAHGLRRSAADKRKAVRLALSHPLGAGMSDRQIAEHVGVSPTTVGKIRQQIEATVQGGQSNSKRKGRDGRTIETANIGKSKPKAEQADVAEQDEVEEADAEYVEVYEDEAAPEGYEYIEVEEEEVKAVEVDAVERVKPAAMESNEVWDLIEDEAVFFAEDDFERFPRMADFLDTICDEVRRNPAVAAARLENTAQRLRTKID